MMPGLPPVRKVRSVTVIVETEDGMVQITRSRHGAISQQDGVEIKQDLAITNERLSDSFTDYRETRSIQWVEEWTEGRVR